MQDLPHDNNAFSSDSEEDPEERELPDLPALISGHFTPARLVDLDVTILDNTQTAHSATYDECVGKAGTYSQASVSVMESGVINSAEEMIANSEDIGDDDDGEDFAVTDQEQGDKRSQPSRKRGRRDRDSSSASSSSSVGSKKVRGVNWNFFYSLKTTSHRVLREVVSDQRTLLSSWRIQHILRTLYLCAQTITFDENGNIIGTLYKHSG